MTSSGFSPVASSPSVPPWGTQSGGGPPPVIPYARIVILEFTQADLVLGAFPAVHNLAQAYVLSRVYDNTGTEIQPDDNVIVDANTLSIVLTSFEPITGTWRAVLVG